MRYLVVPFLWLFACMIMSKCGVNVSDGSFYGGLAIAMMLMVVTDWRFK